MQGPGDDQNSAHCLQGFKRPVNMYRYFICFDVHIYTCIRKKKPSAGESYFTKNNYREMLVQYLNKHPLTDSLTK